MDCGYSISRNGGLTWSRSLIPFLTQTSGGPYVRATDPVAAVDASGNLYLETLATTDANFNNSVVLVSRSTNGGVSLPPQSSHIGRRIIPCSPTRNGWRSILFRARRTSVGSWLRSACLAAAMQTAHRSFAPTATMEASTGVPPCRSIQ